MTQGDRGYDRATQAAEPQHSPGCGSAVLETQEPEDCEEGGGWGEERGREREGEAKQEGRERRTEGEEDASSIQGSDYWLASGVSLYPQGPLWSAVAHPHSGVQPG